MLGWHIMDEGDYRLAVPRLSAEEEGLIAAVEERFMEAARSRHADGRRSSAGLCFALLAGTGLLAFHFINL